MSHDRLYVIFAMLGPLAWTAGCGDDSFDPDPDANPGSASDAAGNSTNDAGLPPGSSDVPSNAYCAEVASWDPSWKAKEAEIIELMNQRRAAGANCGGRGQFGAAPPVSAHEALRCAARKHSKDMVERDFFDHDNPDGESPSQRIEAAGYAWRGVGENIAGGRNTASGTIQQWMDSDPHCANIMNASFGHVGIGYQPGGNHRWTMVLATSR